MCEKCKPKYDHHAHVRLMNNVIQAERQLQVAEAAQKEYERIHGR